MSLRSHLVLLRTPFSVSRASFTRVHHADLLRHTDWKPIIASFQILKPEIPCQPGLFWVVGAERGGLR